MTRREYPVKILITGANSYVGTSFEKYMSNSRDKYRIETLDMINPSWREKPFDGYDVIFHVAGIAHIKETKENAPLYTAVNKELAVKTAEKAKKEGVSQFIFMSSMSVYGKHSGVITKDTKPRPVTDYGKTKLEAERAIQKLACETFAVTILRPPMIYGRNCKGNYAKLSKFARVAPFFPDFKNRRSMIYIDNLSAFVKETIDEKRAGIYTPQNAEYLCTSDIVKEIAEARGRKIKFTRVFNPVIKALIGKNKTITKIFGDLVYEQSEESVAPHNAVDFKTSIGISERQTQNARREKKTAPRQDTAPTGGAA